MSATLTVKCKNDGTLFREGHADRRSADRRSGSDWGLSSPFRFQGFVQSDTPHSSVIPGPPSHSPSGSTSLDGFAGDVLLLSDRVYGGIGAGLAEPAAAGRCTGLRSGCRHQPVSVRRPGGRPSLQTSGLAQIDEVGAVGIDDRKRRVRLRTEVPTEGDPPDRRVTSSGSACRREGRRLAASPCRRPRRYRFAGSGPLAAC